MDRVGNDDLAVGRAEKLFSPGVGEKREQAVVEAGHVQEAARFRLQPELRPRHRFGEFLERPESAGQGMNPSARLAISALRSCIEWTT